MTELRQWVGFDENLALRNWLVGAWSGADRQEGAGRARYGEVLINALAAAFKVTGRLGISLVAAA